MVSSTGNALLGGYMANLGYDMRTIEYATRPAPSEITWLDAVTARGLGIVAVFYIEELPQPWRWHRLGRF